MPSCALTALSSASTAASCKPAISQKGSLAGEVAPFLLGCVLVPCLHGFVVAAGILPPRLRTVSCSNADCVHSSLPWWDQPAWAAVCPHGLVSPNLVFPEACPINICLHCATTHRDAATLSIPELPAVDDPIRWPREWRSDALDAHDTLYPAISSPFAFVALYEHSAAFRDAFSALVPLAASVADRPTALPPRDNAYHFIADVESWLAAYTFTIPFATANPSCVTATIAAINSCRPRLLRRMCDGSALAALREQTALFERISFLALEQPPTFIEFALGPPTVVTSLGAFGVPWRKQWLWWLSDGVPIVQPTVTHVDPHLPSIHHSLDHLLSRDLRAIARAPTPYAFARYHADVWAHIANSAYADVARADLNTVHLAAAARFAVAHARLILAAAAILSPRVASAPAHDAVVLLPHFLAGAAPSFLLPHDGFLGLPLGHGEDPIVLARQLAKGLTISCEPTAVHSIADDSRRVFIFSVPSPLPPPAPPNRVTDATPHDDRPVSLYDTTSLPAAWITERQLADDPRRLFLSLASRRLSHVFFPVSGDTACVGSSGPPVALEDSPEARAWRMLPPSDDAHEQWRVFLQRDAERARELAEAMRSVDRGDGKMVQWAATVTSVADIAHDLEIPSQGVPSIPHNLLFAILPDIYIAAPAPLTSQMLVRLPPQAWPPGCPLPTHATQLLRPWFVRLLFSTVRQLGEREAWCFHHPIPPHATAAQIDAWIASAPPKPPALLAGDGAYFQWTYADGASSFNLSTFLFDVAADGKVQLTDVTREAFTPWFLDQLRERFDPGDQLELLSHVFGGVQSKASCPRQFRIAVNVDGLLTHIRTVADDISKLANAGLYKVRPLVWLDGPLSSIKNGHTGAWPVAASPTWTSPVNAIHKKHSATEKRRLADGSWPRGLPPVRERPHGPPDGPPAVDFNSLVGPMRPPPGTPPVDTPFELTPFGSPCDGCHAGVIHHNAHGRHSWWGALFCLQCWGDGTFLRFEPLKWHKELKHTPRTVMQAAAPLRYLAQESGEYLYAITTDWRVWFWQFGLNPWELWTAFFFAVVRIGECYAFCLVAELVANMGRSHVSNVASAVGSRLYEPIRLAADAREPSLSAYDPPRLQRLVEQRRAQFGALQARLFWCGCYTDDGLSLVLGATRAALIARDIQEQNDQCGIWMAALEKCPVGTFADHIGGRFIINANLSTLTPDKRSRTLHGCHAMARAELSPTDFESEHGLLWHVADLLAIQRSLLNGLGRMLAFARQQYMPKVVLTSDGLARVLEFEQLVARRPYAFITAAVATVVLQPLHSPSPPSVLISSDSCTGMFDSVTGILDPLGAPDPAIFVHAGSLAVRIRLVGAWRLLHITVTETLGSALGALALAPSFPCSPLLVQTDASAALAFLRGRSQSECLQRIYTRWRAEPDVSSFLHRASAQHVAGRSNVVDDAGSRGYWDVLDAYAAACGARLTLLEPPPAAISFLADALLIALDYARAPPPALSAADVRDLRFADAGTLADVIARAAYHRVNASSSPAGLATAIPPRLSSVAAHASGLPRPLPMLPTDPDVRLAFDSTLGYPGEGPPSLPSPPRRQRTRTPRAHASPQPVESSWSHDRQPSPTPPPRPSPASPQPLTQCRSLAFAVPGLAHSPSIASSVEPPRSRSPSRRQASPVPPPFRAAPLASRPATAGAARALATRQIADDIATDSSRFALCPSDPARARAIVNRIRGTQASARAAETRRGDDWGYRWYLNGCDDLGCDPIRPSDVLHARREAMLGGHVVMNAAAKMRPRDRSRKAADPSSAWSAYKKARGVLHDLGCLLPPLDEVRDVLRGLLRDFVRNYGDDVLVTEKKQPFSRAHELALERSLRERTVDDLRERLHLILWITLCFLRNIGARGSELCKGDLFFTRSNVAPIVGGSVVAPTLENFARASRIRVMPTGSKCDFTNKHWGAHPMFFDVAPGEHLNLGHALITLEREFPCPPHLRATFPILFDPTKPAHGAPPPVPKSWLDARHSKLLVDVLGPDVAARRTVHSWRVTLGCSLRAARDANHPDGRSLEIVKAFGRWRSDAAVAGYARLSADAYASHVRASLAADAAAVPAPSVEAVMRSVDPVDMIENVHLAIHGAPQRNSLHTPASAATAPPSAGPDAAAVARMRQRLTPRSSAASGAVAPSARPHRRRRRSATPAGSPPSTPEAPPTLNASRVALTSANAHGRLVIVPSTLWPDYPCDENGGRGWTATLRRVSRGVATLRFTTLRDAHGRRDDWTYHLKLDAIETL